MRSVALALVLVTARLLSLAGQTFPAATWLVPALVWHDLLVAALWFALDRLSGRWAGLWLVYGLLVCWIALNVPVVRALSSPLTLTMVRAAGGALRDSIAYYVTPFNIIAMTTVLVVGAVSPSVVERVSRQLEARRAGAVVRGLAWTATAVVIAMGPFLHTRVETRGLERNAITSMVMSALSPLGATTMAAGRRESPFGDTRRQDLSSLEGQAAGMNVILVVLESTGAQYLRPWGAPDDPMPTLTALAQQGIVFERAYAAYPESIKSLFALLCGREPPADVANGAPTDTCAPIAGEFTRLGYQTALFHSGRFAYLGMDAVLARQQFGLLEDAGAIGGEVRSSFGVDEPSTVRRMLTWLDAQKARPFFVTYLPVAGHHPYATPEPGPFADGTELGAYKDALRHGDRALGELIDGLRARGLLERSIVVVVGDHGEAFGQHAGNAGHTMFLYEENVHVPLVVVVPGQTAGTRVDRVSSVVDIAPTMLALLGREAPTAMAGQSLLGPAERMALFETDYSLPWRGLRDGCWKYLIETSSNRSQLYDVCADPGESRDLSGVHPERVDAYRVFFRRPDVSAPRTR